MSVQNHKRPPDQSLVERLRFSVPMSSGRQPGHVGRLHLSTGRIWSKRETFMTIKGRCKGVPTSWTVTPPV